MDPSEPRPKKYCRLPLNLPLPVMFKKDGSLQKFKGIFNGFNVVIEDEEEMKSSISMGYFGKASLSRSYPQFSQTRTEIIRERQYGRRRAWAEKFPNKKPKKKIIVVPDSDEENEDYFTSLQPKYQLDGSGIQETVWLGLEEAFFLASAVKCLNIHTENKRLELEEAWSAFAAADPFFVQNYVVYYNFRSKNWVVKPGIKFGGDFLLYKQGPPFYHASYVVVIDVVNEDWERIETLSRRCMDDVPLLSLNRLCETAGKELLICRVIWPENIHVDYRNMLDRVVIKESLLRRWIPTQERNSETV